MRAILAWIAATLLCSSLASGQERQRAASPQRPSFSNNALTTYPQSIELEAGFSIDDNLLDTPALIKYGFATYLEGFFGVSPVVRREFRSRDEPFGPVRTRSNTEAFERATLGVKYRLQDAVGDVPAIAFQISTTEFDNFVFMGIYSQQLQQYLLDANLALAFDGGTTLTGIVTFSRQVNAQVGVFGEALLENNFERDDPMFILGVGGSLSRNPLQVWDAALHFGLINASFDIRLQIGLTANLGILQR